MFILISRTFSHLSAGIVSLVGDSGTSAIDSVFSYRSLVTPVQRPVKPYSAPLPSANHTATIPNQNRELPFSICFDPTVLVPSQTYHTEYLMDCSTGFDYWNAYQRDTANRVLYAGL